MPGIIVMKSMCTAPCLKGARCSLCIVSWNDHKTDQSALKGIITHGIEGEFVIFLVLPCRVVFSPDVWGQLDHQAHQRSHLHLQPPHGTAVPQDHPHLRVGRPETSGTGKGAERGTWGVLLLGVWRADGYHVSLAWIWMLLYVPFNSWSCSNYCLIWLDHPFFFFFFPP